MMIIPATKKHARVEELKAKRQAAKDGLYYHPVGKPSEPMFAADLHNEKMRAIEADFDTALLELMDNAQKRYDDAEARLAKVDRPYDWLASEELRHAAELAPFIREDLAGLDGQGVVDAIRNAAEAGRVVKWLLYRYAPRRVAELDNQQETALGMSIRAHYVKELPALRDSVMLPSQLKEWQAAQKELDDAKTLYEAAEWARPSVRQEFANRASVAVEYLPD